MTVEMVWFERYLKQIDKKVTGIKKKINNLNLKINETNRG